MLMPKKVKYRKHHRGRMRGRAKGGDTLAFGDYGLQALEPGWVTARQIEAARIAITRHIKRGGKVWIRVFPDKPITKKPLETRMGKGKGEPGGVGGGGQAGAGALRARGGAATTVAEESDAPGRPQAGDQDPVRDPPRQPQA